MNRHPLGRGIRRDRRHSHSRSGMHTFRIIPPCPQLPYCHTHAHAPVQSPSPGIYVAAAAATPPTSTTRRPACRRLSSFSDEGGVRVAVAPPSTKIASHSPGTSAPRSGPALERGADPSSVSASPPSRRVVRRRVMLLRTFSMSIVVEFLGVFVLFVSKDSRYK